MKNFKHKVLQACSNLVEERMELARNLILEAQSAANQDAKSSMGDKYETSREMMALEMRKAGEQLQEASKLNKVLSSINPSFIGTQVSIGSLVLTTMGLFFLSVSLGKIEVEGKEVFALSAVSPLGKELNNRKFGDTFIFNSKVIEILKVQ